MGTDDSPRHGDYPAVAAVPGKKVIYVPMYHEDASKTSASTSYSTFKTDVLFDKSKYENVVSIKLVALIGISSVGETVYLELWDEVGGVSITGSEISYVGDIKDHFVKSNDIKANLPSSEIWLRNRYKVTSGTGRWKSVYLEVELSA